MNILTIGCSEYVSGVELCQRLKIKNASDALSYVPDDMKIKHKNSIYLTPGGFLYMLQRASLVTAQEKQFIAREIFGESVPVLLLSRPETEFFSKLCGILDELGIKYTRQYSVLDFKVDMYLNEHNICLEYDERSHCFYDFDQQEGRELAIIEHLQCDFLRLKDSDSDEKNIALVIKALFSWH